MGKAMAVITYEVELDESYIEYKTEMGYSTDDMIRELKQKGVLSVYVSEFKIKAVELEQKSRLSLWLVRVQHK